MTLFSKCYDFNLVILDLKKHIFYVAYYIYFIYFIKSEIYKEIYIL